MIGSTSSRLRTSPRLLPRLRAGRPYVARLLVGGAILSLAAATGVTLLPAGEASATTATSACAGVTVVVDSTDLGGEVKTGCAATGFDTGVDALHSAGFASTDSQPGLVCAIDSKPNPCPTKFEGSFWSYWHGDSTAAEWASYQVGAATSHPKAGTVEGWRYNDGTTGPTLSPQKALTQSAATPSAAAQAHPTAVSHNPGFDPIPLIVTLALVVLVGVLTTVLLLRRRVGRREN